MGFIRIRKSIQYFAINLKFRHITFMKTKFLYAVSLIVIFSCTNAQKRTDHIVTIKTKYGDMVAILYDETPKHKANFIKLANEHFFDSTLFHRVIPGFMIQGGDPQSKRAQPGQRLGNGGPNYTIEAEINPKFLHVRGALSAARLGDQVNPTRASSGSQFYVVQGKKYTENELRTDAQLLAQALQKLFQRPENQSLKDSIMTFYQAGDMKGYENYIMSLKPVIEQQLGIKVDKNVSEETLKLYTTIGGAPHLDGQYTVFGKVIKGLEVVDRITALQRDRGDRPVEDVRMFVTVRELPVSEIEKLYGYKYSNKE